MAKRFQRAISLIDPSKTKAWGPYTRELLRVFRDFCDEEENLHFSEIRNACHVLDLYPSASQAHEMLMCAIEYGSPCKPDHITFGEFCVLVLELQNHYCIKFDCTCIDHLQNYHCIKYVHRHLQNRHCINPKPPVPLSYVRSRPDVAVARRKRRVFLGGSCNPTKWRADQAIPFFKEHSITFYNPVQNWRPELMEQEAQAKQMADVLFFVLDSKTRAISSMIEVAYLVATQRQVVVTMCEYQDDKIEIHGEMLTDKERMEMVKGRLILTDLIERNSIPIFSDITSALKCTRQILEGHISIKELTVQDGAQPVKHGHLKLGQALLELREAFNSVDSTNLGYLTIQDVCLAYKSCTGTDLDSGWLKQRRKSKDQYDYEEFCCIITEYRKQTSHKPFFQRVMSHILQPFRWLIAKFNPASQEAEDDESSDEIRDVYLGGSSSSPTEWRKDIVQPALRKHGLSYVDPDVHNWDQKLIPIHVATRDRCRLLFYVITGCRRSLGSMCEAGYYIGRGCRMVLCVHKIPDDAVIDGEKLTSCAIKDYNRGRDYLSDLANREGIPLFDNVEEALTTVISMLTDQGHPTMS